MANLKQPSLHDLRLLRGWMERSDLGDVYLAGRDSTIWSNDSLQDLFVVRHRAERDLFSNWVEDKLVGWFYSSITRVKNVRQLSFSLKTAYELKSYFRTTVLTWATRSMSPIERFYELPEYLQPYLPVFCRSCL